MTANVRALAGKTAVVTGASSGIGAATAIALATAGADVLVHARINRAAAEITAAAVEKQAVRANVILADLRDMAEQDRLVEQAISWQGRVDIWVNNAGADVLTGEAAEWSFERKFEEVWRVDVVGTMRLSRLIGRHMQDRDEAGDQAIVNIGWDQAAQGMAGDSGEMFAASKGAIMAFTRSLAQSLAPRVRVNCAAPGWIRTAWGDQATATWQQRALAESLVERWGTADDVAQAITFLASPGAAFITGQVLPVNGGFRYGHAPLRQESP